MNLARMLRIVSAAAAAVGFAFLAAGPPGANAQVQDLDQRVDRQHQSGADPASGTRLRSGLRGVFERASCMARALPGAEQARCLWPHCNPPAPGNYRDLPSVADIPLGYWSTISMVRRGFDLSGDLKIDAQPHGEYIDPQNASIFPLTDLPIFAILAGTAIAYRRKPEIHKRLMLFANIALMGAPLAHYRSHCNACELKATGDHHDTHLHVPAGCGGAGLRSDAARSPAYVGIGGCHVRVRPGTRKSHRPKCGMAPLRHLARPIAPS